MPEFKHAHASGRDWREAARSCAAQLHGSPGNLGFLYATDLVAPQLGEVLSMCRKATGVPHWVGTVGLGVCATGEEYFDEPAVVAMIGEFEPDAFKVFSGVSSEEDAKRLELRCGGGQAAFAMVHADPTNSEISAVIPALARKVESGFLMGGLTSSRQQNLQIADRVLDGGISGVAFADTVAIATRLTQGCSPIGPRHQVTSCQRNIVMTLDGKPALEVFLEDVGESIDGEVERIGGHVFVGIAIPGSDTGDYIVRNLVGIDPTNKLLAIGELVQPGASIMFCRRDAESAAEDMTRMLESIKQGLYAPARGAVYYSCLARGPNLFGANSEELTMIRSALGEVPLVGFFCNGEISHNRLYGYTGVLTLFV